jgi:hypothetical protein
MTNGNEMQYAVLFMVGVIMVAVSLRLGFFLGQQSESKKRDEKLKMEMAKEQELERYEIGIEFFGWLKAGLLNSGLNTNHPGSRVFFIEEGILILSPYIFEDFIKSDNRYQEETSKHVQRRFIKYLENKQSMVRTAVGLATHTYEFKAGNSSSLLNGYLIPKHLIFNEGSHNYNVSAYMKNISGFHIKTKAFERTQPKEVRRLKAV